MDTEILRSLMNCSLTKEEAKPVLLEEEDLIDGVIECEASVFVKIHSLNLSRELVARGDPLEVSLMSVNSVFKCVDLKEEFYTKEVASKLSSSFMACEIMELRRDMAGKKFFRVKATVNVHQPIRRLVNFQVEMMQGAGYLAYERLPHCASIVVISSRLNVEEETNGRDNVSDPISPKFKTTLNANYLDLHATFNSETANLLPHGTVVGFTEAITFFDFQNMAPTISQPKESSLQKVLPEGKRILKGSHSKGMGLRKRHHPYHKDDGTHSPGKKTLLSDSQLDYSKDLDSRAEVARQPSRTP
ncbi:hypothetical protein LIER_42140 [Lithospermum erythrorhizon]|uniref:Uncharacterized protein n=1 Tax=Lithospermum erythrorhizon TaxID=34254 RepID=A0AAV3RND4_LITER